MASFLVFFEVFGSVVAVYPPKSGYSSAEAPYFDFELSFGSCCHVSRDRLSMDEND